MSTVLLGLEARIRELPGVMGCVIFLGPKGDLGEIQVFIERGREKDPVQDAIEVELERAGVQETIRVIHVFELESASYFGDRETLERALELAEQEARARGPLSLDDTGAGPIDLVGFRWDASKGLGRRPVLQRVILSATDAGSEAEVSLELLESSIVASAAGEKTPHGLSVVAEATLEACKQIVVEFEAKLLGASLVTLVGSEAVIVMVRVGDHDLLGSALLRSGPASEAAVRATLDAVNRVLVSG